MNPAVFILLLFLTSNCTYADSVIEEKTIISNNSQSTNIPYKEDKELSQQAIPVISALLVFAVLVVGFLYFFKSKLSLVGQVSGKNINILEIKRLNSRFTVFHLKVKNRELLILQSGDSVKTVELNNAPDDLENS